MKYQLGLAAWACLAGAASLQAAPIKVMAVGDSITANTNVHYREAVSDFALQHGCDLAFVGQYADGTRRFATKHSAISGIRADTVDNSYISQWMLGSSPNVVLIHLGTNDSWQGRPAAATVSSLSGIIDKIRLHNPAATILLSQIIPSTIQGLNQLATQVNALIPALVASKDTASSRVLVVDQYTGFNAVADTTDGVHPNQNGQYKMAARWFEKLQAAGVCKPSKTLMNLAAYRPTVVSPPGPNVSPHMVFDQDMSTVGWSKLAPTSAPQVLEVDLGQAATISFLELTHYARWSDATDLYTTRGYRIDLSADRLAWWNVVTVTNNTSGRTTHAIAPSSARFVRLTVDTPNAWTGYNQVNIREFRVMGVPK